MAPKKAIDKGKAPMSEAEEVSRPRTRSRGTGIVIRERAEDERELQGAARQAGTAEPAVEAQGVPVDDVPGPAQADEPGSSRAVPVQQAMPGSEARMAVMMETMLGMMQSFQDFVRMQGQQRGSPTRRASPLRSERGHTPVRERRRRRVREDRADMKSFQDMHPPAFQGELDYRVADKWVTRMEKIFEYLQCTEVQKIRYATYMLEGEAEDWWQTERQTVPAEERLTWANFLERFYHQFVPESERSKRASEFMSLIQARQTVAEYAARFVSLRRFVPWALTDQREAARKFQEGLRPAIRSKVAPFKLVEYRDVLDRALVVEREEEEVTRLREKRKGRFPDRQGRRQQKPRIGQAETSRGRGVCFQCGQAGHRKAECPQLQRTEQEQTSR